jgi:hypothetical protein
VEGSRDRALFYLRKAMDEGFKDCKPLDEDKVFRDPADHSVVSKVAQ